MAAVENTPEVRAVAKTVRVSPRKARLVVDHIRGRSVPEARTILAFTTRAVADDIEKVLGSAVAAAESAHGLNGDDLYVSAVYVDEGPTIKLSPLSDGGGSPSTPPEKTSRRFRSRARRRKKETTA